MSDRAGRSEPGTGTAEGDPGRQRWLTPGVLSVGAASLGGDSGHELTTGLLPTFLTSTLHAGPAALGVIEGVPALATAATGPATAVWQVAVLRALSWVSRGLRSPARDTLLMSLVPRTAHGRAGGVERAGDSAGALVGPLLAAGLVGVLGVRHTMLIAFVPDGRPVADSRDEFSRSCSTPPTTRPLRRRRRRAGS